MTNQILFLDHDDKYVGTLKSFLKPQPYELIFKNVFEEKITESAQKYWDIIIANPFAPYVNQEKTNVNQEKADANNGADTSDNIAAYLNTLKKQNPSTQILILAPREKLDTAMDLLGSNVLHYIQLPVNTKALGLAIKAAFKNISMENRINRYSEKIVNLHKEHDLLNQLFEEVPCYISVQDKNLKITTANKKFKDHFAGGIGGFCYKTYKHRTSPCTNCPVMETFSDGKSHSTEEIVTSKFGKQYNVLTQTAPIRDEYGEISQVMEMSTDITQIRQLQDHLVSLGLMLGSMSHGVKGMLTALDGGVYQLEMGLDQKDDDRVLKAFGQIRQMTDKVKKMVLEILYYAKSRQLRYERVKVVDFAQNILDTIEPMAKHNSISLDILISQTLRKIEIDPSWMEAALVNFLENAVDACNLDAEKENHCIEFNVSRKSKEHICFTITDNGVGMDTETKNSMFTLFFTSKGSQGTGLGLFIANKVIQYHGGSIEVESKKGVGSKFSINLPYKKPESIIKE